MKIKIKCNLFSNRPIFILLTALIHRNGSEIVTVYTGESVNSRTVSGSVHIYADPDEYDVVAGGLMMPDEQSCQQQQQLDPAHITIDAVVHRGISLLLLLVLLSASLYFSKRGAY